MSDILKFHKNITVIGWVQGVGFRFACRSMARSLGIKGLVKNLSDGNVYIEAEGTETQIKHFVKWCHQGPGNANITDVRVETGKVESYNVFDITR